MQDMDFDVVLIGGGIMSATLGVMLTVLDPQCRIAMLERRSDVATESSGAWNNAGTGHAGYCELNYMPDPSDASTAVGVNRSFDQSRQWWSQLQERVLLDGDFLTTVPHVTAVFGRDDVEYLRRRARTLRETEQFARIEFTDDPATVAQWAPLVMAGRDPAQPVAATRHPDGSDIDFGKLTRTLTKSVTSSGGQLLLDHDVHDLVRHHQGWLVRGTQRRKRFQFTARRVFVGAGGNALRLLQKAELPEVRGYGVLPVGAAFLRCSDPTVVRRHDAKVYGKANDGAPPMSLPHLDKRVVDGRQYLVFGPFAMFSTKLLKHGSLTDVFATVNRHNVRILTAALAHDRNLLRYLAVQLLKTRQGRFAQLQEFYPQADPGQWELVTAGQRAQLVVPDHERTGAIQMGTQLIVSADGTMAGLLGASPGASTAVSIMTELLQRGFSSTAPRPLLPEGRPPGRSHGVTA